MSSLVIPIANVLPVTAAIELKRAANTPVPPDDPLARIRAIERATQRVKRQFPQFFQQES